MLQPSHFPSAEPHLWDAARGSSCCLPGDDGNGFFSDGPEAAEHRGRSLMEVKAGGRMDYGQTAFRCLDGFGGVHGAAVVWGCSEGLFRVQPPPCPVLCALMPQFPPHLQL